MTFTPLALPAWLVLLTVVLASARLFRLLTVDSITAPIRSAYDTLVLKIGDSDNRFRRNLASDMDHGFFCAYCAGFWLALATLMSAMAWSDTIVWQILAGSLAVNYVSAVLNVAHDGVPNDDEDE